MFNLVPRKKCFRAPAVAFFGVLFMSLFAPAVTPVSNAVEVGETTSAALTSHNISQAFGLSFGATSSAIKQELTNSDEQINTWINENYVQLMRSSNAEILSAYEPAAFSDFTVGTPRVVTNFADEEVEDNGYSLDINGEYVAVISNPNGLPVLLLNFVKQGQKITNGSIIEDSKLAEQIFALTDETVIVHDQPTKAWYLITADKIEAIDEGGEKVLLGSLPVIDFLQQRSRLLGVGVENLDTLPDTLENQNSAKNGQRQLVKLLWGFAAGGFLLLSVSWLIWERRELGKRNPVRARDAAQAREKLMLPENSQWREVDGYEYGARLSFRQAARRITTYRRRSTATSAETQVKAETQIDSEVKVRSRELKEESQQGAEGLEQERNDLLND